MSKANTPATLPGGRSGRRRLDRAPERSAAAGVGRAGSGPDDRQAVAEAHSSCHRLRCARLRTRTRRRGALRSDRGTRGFTVETTASGEQEVAGIADELIPVLGSAPVTRRWAGLRPGTPDGLPIFGAEPEAPNLWYATGYGRNGILFAGITGIALTHLMAREATFDGVRALSPGRFWSW